MNNMITDFLEFCGLNYQPNTLGELFTWLVGVFFCVFLVAGCIRILFNITWKGSHLC